MASTVAGASAVWERKRGPRHAPYRRDDLQRWLEKYSAEMRPEDSLLDEMRRVQKKAWELLGKFEAEQDWRGATVALREVRECVESLGELLARAVIKPVESEPRLEDALRAKLAILAALGSRGDGLTRELPLAELEAAERVLAITLPRPS